MLRTGVDSAIAGRSTQVVPHTVILLFAHLIPTCLRFLPFNNSVLARNPASALNHLAKCSSFHLTCHAESLWAYRNVELDSSSAMNTN